MDYKTELLKLLENPCMNQWILKTVYEFTKNIMPQEATVSDLAAIREGTGQQESRPASKLEETSGETVSTVPEPESGREETIKSFAVTCFDLD